MTERRRALLSVSDKTGIESFAKALAERGFEILSTGGTARTLRDAGVAVTDVSEVTGHPEIMEGRVKTLHPAIHGPLLARRDVPGDLEALQAHGYEPIDVVAVNLYPFRETIARGDVTVAEAMKKVDIGGPTMIRAAAKNHASVWVIVDPSDYGAVVEALDSGRDGRAVRQRLAQKVFEHISAYDAAIASFLDRPESANGAGEAEPATAGLPAQLSLDYERVRSLRYGENPDQAAAFYAPTGGARVGIASLEQHHGKELSYNNLLDLDGALLSLAPFAVSPRPAVAIIKHTTPCGLAVGDTVESAYWRALATDPVSSFGSVIAVNRVVDEAAAGAMSDLFIECIVAPGFSGGAMEVLTQKKNLRLLTFPDRAGGVGDLMLPAGALESLDDASGARTSAAFLAAHGRDPRPLVVRGIYGGLLAQTPPVPPFFGVASPEWKVVTERAPTAEEANDLAFAWAAVFGIKSNAILLAKDGATLGIGAGQMSRVDSSRLAVQKAADAGLDLTGCSLASDAFFPFADGVEAAAEAGVRAIVQPGGSIRDEDVIQRANELDLAMVFTGQRLFRH